jgi:hypothetical protein
MKQTRLYKSNQRRVEEAKRRKNEEQQDEVYVLFLTERVIAGPCAVPCANGLVQTIGRIYVRQSG